MKEGKGEKGASTEVGGLLSTSHGSFKLFFEAVIREIPRSIIVWPQVSVPSTFRPAVTSRTGGTTPTVWSSA